MPATQTKEPTMEIEFTCQPTGAMPAIPDQVSPPAVAHQSEAAALGDFLQRAASDPRVDIDKLERLIALKKDMEATAAQREFDSAMRDAQREMDPVRADANNPQTRSKYASYHALDEAIRPIYTKHGFSVTFNLGRDAPENFVNVICKVAHSSGHREYHDVPMPADGKGAKGGEVMTRTHATGAAITYGKRYGLGMAFNIAVSFDDDGNGASASKPVSRGVPAEDRHLLKDGETRSAYRMDKIKKARDGGWRVTNTTPKGKRDQIYDYLDMAETIEDVDAIINHNTQAIAETGEATRIDAAADKIKAWIVDNTED